MEEFYAKYGAKDNNDLMEKVKSDGAFASRIITDLLAEKFPAPVVEEPVAEHQSGEVETHENEEHQA